MPILRCGLLWGCARRGPLCAGGYEWQKGRESFDSPPLFACEFAPLRGMVLQAPDAHGLFGQPQRLLGTLAGPLGPLHGHIAE